MQAVPGGGILHKIYTSACIQDGLELMVGLCGSSSAEYCKRSACSTDLGMDPVCLSVLAKRGCIVLHEHYTYACIQGAWS